MIVGARRMRHAISKVVRSFGIKVNRFGIFIFLKKIKSKVLSTSIIEIRLSLGKFNKGCIVSLNTYSLSFTSLNKFTLSLIIEKKHNSFCVH